MNQAGLYALLSILLFRYFFKSEAIFFKNFILGILFPSLLNSFFLIVSLFTGFPPTIYFYNNSTFSFSHSLFIALILAVMLYIVSEIKRNRHYKIAGVSFLLGFIVHVFCDMIFWVDPVYVFWPIRDSDLALTLSGLLFEVLDKCKSQTLIALLLEFLFLQFYAKSLIEVLIEGNSDAKIIQTVTSYQIRQLNLFVIFFILFFVFYYMDIGNSNFLFIPFNILYFLSLFTAIFITYKAKIVFSK